MLAFVLRIAIIRRNQPPSTSSFRHRAGPRRVRGQRNAVAYLAVIVYRVLFDHGAMKLPTVFIFLIFQSAERSEFTLGAGFICTEIRIKPFKKIK